MDIDMMLDDADYLASNVLCKWLKTIFQLLNAITS